MLARASSKPHDADRHPQPGPAMKRDKFITRPILLKTESQRNIIRCLVDSLPCDADHPIEVVVREPVKVRGMDANARMWVGPLKDIAEQGYVNGRTYSAEVWHEHFKIDHLPDETADDFDPSHVKEGYRKWDYTPAGDRVLIGSTTQLTVKGFAQYLTQVEAAGANIGVQFSASPNDRMAA